MCLDPFSYNNDPGAATLGGGEQYSSVILVVEKNEYWNEKYCDSFCTWIKRKLAEY